MYSWSHEHIKTRILTFINYKMEVKINLGKYAKKLTGIIIDKTVMMDQIFDVIISDEDKAKVFFLISEKLRETGEEYLSLIKKRSWKN